MQQSTPLEKQALGLFHNFEINDRSAPTVFMVHGRAGDARVMLAFRRILPEGWNIFLPEAPLNDPQGGFSWWRVDHSEDTQKQERRQNIASLSDFIDKALNYHQITNKKVIGVGFSQGSAALSRIFLSSYKLSALAVLAGFILPTEGTVTSNRRPVFIGHGTKDDIITLDRSQKGESLLKELGYSVATFYDEVGHKIGTNAMKGLKNWMQTLPEV